MVRKGLDAIEIRGVWVKLFKGNLTVEVERGDKWVEILSEKIHGADDIISHIIEPNGIESCRSKASL